MANRAKAKGTSWETAIVRWLQDRGFDARRKVLAGAKDEGDIDVGDWVIEAKNVRALALAQWIEEARVESINSGRPVVVVAKRVGKGDPGEGYVVMTLSQFAEHVLSASVRP